MRRQLVELGGALLLGAAVMWLTIGFQVLDLTNTDWLFYNDAAANLMGWESFRQSPWTFPIGMIRGYGPAGDTSIVFTDAIPLLAVPFKLMQPVLPASFQYFGLWLLICFVLQAWLGRKLVALYTEHVSQQWLGAAFFALSPAIASRLLPESPHIALCSHFLILAALYFALRPIRPRHDAAWIVLLAVAILVHAYIFAMVGAIWIADLIDRRRENALRAFLSAVGIVGAVAFSLGYFTVDGGAGGPGYGDFRAAALALIDPRDAAGLVWTRVFPTSEYTQLQHEGFTYIGLGSILLALAVLVVSRRRKESAISWKAQVSRHRALMIAVAGMSVFAMTNRVGTWATYVEIPLPHVLQQVASLFRASGRFMWPTMYVLVLVIIVMTTRVFRRSASLLLALALLLQVADAWPALEKTRDYPVRSALSAAIPPLGGDFWACNAAAVRSVRRIDPVNYSTGWQRIAKWAIDNGIETRVVYVNRLSASEMSAAYSELDTMVRTGTYATDSIYVVSDERKDDVLRSLRSQDALFSVDDFLVLVPEWRRLEGCVGDDIPEQLR